MSGEPLSKGSLLLHTCCGPCSTLVARGFVDAGYSVTGLFYNPNIHPYDEYHRRREAAESWANAAGVPLITDTGYEPEGWIVAVGGNVAERCAQCYRLRLNRTARKALELGHNSFSTTLLISPHQQHEVIRRVGDEVAKDTGLSFIYRDFRPDFKKTYQLSRDLGLYRQSYCGCILSDRERAERQAVRHKNVN